MSSLSWSHPESKSGQPDDRWMLHLSARPLRVIRSTTRIVGDRLFLAGPGQRRIDLDRNTVTDRRAGPSRGGKIGTVTSWLTTQLTFSNLLTLFIDQPGDLPRASGQVNLSRASGQVNLWGVLLSGTEFQSLLQVVALAVGPAPVMLEPSNHDPRGDADPFSELRRLL